MKKISLCVLAIFFIFNSSIASAFTLTAKGGYSFGSGTAHNALEKGSPMIGGELTYGLGNIFQLGGFYEFNSLKSTSAAVTDPSLHFFGAVGRVGLGPLSGFFVDVQLGLTQTKSNGSSSDSVFGFGAGLGYDLSIVPMVGIKPRLGYRSLPNNSGGTSLDRSMFDLNLLISFSI